MQYGSTEFNIKKYDFNNFMNPVGSMSKSEELKERINYLKGVLVILAGIVVLTCGGLVNQYLNDHINDVFWLGVGLVIVILFFCLKVASRIEEHLQELGRL